MNQDTKTDLGPLLVIVGPTAVGKTELSLALAKDLDGEIVSGDAFQVYKGLDIGTAKIQPEAMQGIPHHLIDICDPSEPYTAADFQKQASVCIAEIQKRGRLPILVGGTGLYVNGLIYHYSFGNAEPVPQLRFCLEDAYNKYGGEAMWSRLHTLDPKAAEGLFPQDRQRLVRALEIALSSGRGSDPKGQERAAYASNYRCVLIGLDMERQALYQRINDRVEKMFAEGLVEEVQGLLAAGLDPEARALQAIGYKELLPYFAGKRSLDDAKELIKRHSRRLAKRQWTWFRKDPNMDWLDVQELTSAELVCAIKNRIKMCKERS